MRLWSDVLDREKVYKGLQDANLPGVYAEVERFVPSARKRAHRIDVRLEGTDTRHTRYRNPGTSGDGHNDVMAATWMDWGWFLAVLFRFDPNMESDWYHGRDDFLRSTAGMWVHRLSTKDRSCVEWANSRYGLDEFGPGYTPFADLSHLPPNRLLRLDDTEQVDAWLAS